MQRLSLEQLFYMLLSTTTGKYACLLVCHIFFIKLWVGTSLSKAEKPKASPRLNNCFQKTMSACLNYQARCNSPLDDLAKLLTEPNATTGNSTQL